MKFSENREIYESFAILVEIAFFAKKRAPRDFLSSQVESRTDGRTENARTPAAPVWAHAPRPRAHRKKTYRSENGLRPPPSLQCLSPMHNLVIDYHIKLFLLFLSIFVSI